MVTADTQPLPLSGLGPHSRRGLAAQQRSAKQISLQRTRAVTGRLVALLVALGDGVRCGIVQACALLIPERARINPTFSGPFSRLCVGVLLYAQLAD